MGAGWREERVQAAYRATYSPAITHTRILTPVFIPSLPHWTRLATLCLPRTECSPAPPRCLYAGMVARGHQRLGF